MGQFFPLARQFLRLIGLILQRRARRAAIRRMNAEEREAVVRRLLNERGIFPD